MTEFRVLELLGKYYLSFSNDDRVFTDIQITRDQYLKLRVDLHLREGNIIEMDTNQQKFVSIGEKIAFFDETYGVLMVSKINRILSSDEYMATVAGDYKYREFTKGIRDDRFVFFVDEWDHAIYGGQILRNIRHIDRVVDQLIPDILP